MVYSTAKFLLEARIEPGLTNITGILPIISVKMGNDEYLCGIPLSDIFTRISMGYRKNEIRVKKRLIFGEIKMTYAQSRLLYFLVHSPHIFLVKYLVVRSILNQNSFGIRKSLGSRAFSNAGRAR